MRSPHSAQRKRAALLLEVVVAMTILVTAMGILGAQLARGLEMTDYSERELRASQMVDRILALIEFDPQTQSYIFTDREETEYEFSETDDQAYWRLREMYPDYLWRVRTQRVDPESDELWRVEVDILHQSDPELYGSFDDARLVRRLAFLRAKPAQINVDELNLSEESLAGMGLDQDLIAQVPDLMGILGGFETGNISIQQLIASLDPETLRALMPLIQAAIAQLGGGGLPVDFNQLQQFGGASPEQLVQMIQGMAGAAGVPRGGPPFGGQRPGGGGRRPPGGQGGEPEMEPDVKPKDLIGGGSGPNGEYTIEDLMRMRDDYERRQGGRR